MSCTESLFMLDIVGTLNPELWGIRSSFGGAASVMSSGQVDEVIEGGSEV